MDVFSIKQKYSGNNERSCRRWRFSLFNCLMNTLRKLVLLMCINFVFQRKIECSLFSLFLNWDSLHARLASHCRARSYRKKEEKKMLSI